ncbi:Ubiquitin-related domain,Ubiquitin domain [Cinara cedri]|uniref:Ubiquitin-related domain,Ubiquitin domain n=1 Tax=Cinara cedri TaxID=506608 RepID=A0A5E4NB03_9HEMI|nr:Ubiquitin-related domain,Ubiquitin domain [Cinara cedri]
MLDTAQLYELQLSSTDTVQDIKDKILANEKILCDYQKSMILKSGGLEKNVNMEDVVFHLSPTKLKMKIVAKRMTGKLFSVDVNPKDTVKDLKERIHAQEEKLEGKTNLINNHNNCMLENDRTVSYYRIEKDNDVEFIIQLGRKIPKFN